MLNTFCSNRVRPRDFDPGDLVLYWTDVGNKNAREGKLEAYWEGPYRVTREWSLYPRITSRPPNPKNMGRRQTQTLL